MQAQQPPPPQPKRNQITLFEFFAVIVVLAIVIGILVPVLGPMNSGRGEFIVAAEITQLDMAIENFYTEYGFYPPDFSDIHNASEFNEYLLKFAPDHREDLDAWWREVGSRLNPSNALVFWLSGLRNSRQYPLSYDHDGNESTPRMMAPVHTENPKLRELIGERKVFFEFKRDRLQVSGNVSAYGQAKGNTQLPYIYFCSSYRKRSGKEKSFTEATTGDMVRPYLESPSVADVYHNQDRFQIIAPGLDNRYGTYGNGVPDWQASPYFELHRDNNTNISNGRRLDSLIE